MTKRAVSLTNELWKAVEEARAVTGLPSASAVIEQAGRAFVKNLGIDVPASAKTLEKQGGS